MVDYSIGRLSNGRERLSAVVPVEFGKDEEPNTVTGMAYNFSSIAFGERGPTRIPREAFAGSLAKTKSYPLLWQHLDHVPIGRADLSLVAEGVFLKAHVADSTQGRDAIAVAKTGGLTGLSLGFIASDIKKEKHEEFGTIRVVGVAELMEVSFVTYPADESARIRTVHRAAYALAETALKEATRDDVLAVLGALDSTADEKEIQAGRVFSSRNLTRMKDALAALVELVGKVDAGFLSDLAATLAPPVAPDPVEGQKKGARGRELLRAVRAAELQMAGVDSAYGAAKSFNQIIAEQAESDAQWKRHCALMDSIRSILDDDNVADKGSMIRESVNQYLAAEPAA